MNASTPVSWDVPEDQIVRSSRGRGWVGLDGAEVVHAECDFTVPALDQHIVVFNLGEPMTAREQRSGRGGRLADTSVMVLPAARERVWQLEPAGEVRHLHLYLPQSTLAGVANAAGFPGPVDLAEAHAVEDHALAALGGAVTSELRSDGRGGHLYAESLRNLIAVHLLRHYSTIAPREVAQSAALPAPLLRRAIEYIEANLATDLHVEDIAGAVALSQYHFARLFRASTGLPVYRYVIQRRVERAVELLRTTDATTTAVAHQVGFANRSHLAHHLRRVLGVSPSEIRER